MISAAAAILPGVAVVLTPAAPTFPAARGDNKEHERMVLTFNNPQSIESWSAVNDDVMGGVSDGGVRSTDSGTMGFFGSLSLENNGGFASIRSSRRDVDLASFDGLLVRLRGDGKRYCFNLRTDVRIMAGSYRVAFDTNADEWQEIYLPFADFRPASFGRVRSDLPPLDPSKIRSFGFLISDKQVGPFALEVEWIKAVKAPVEKTRQVSDTPVETGSTD
jgi:NADH dehydrogenase [ubiquinone] 1 alpha subcomplex assembly factor 1